MFTLSHDLRTSSISFFQAPVQVSPQSALQVQHGNCHQKSLYLAFLAACLLATTLPRVFRSACEKNYFFSKDVMVVDNVSHADLKLIRKCQLSTETLIVSSNFHDGLAQILSFL